jgi:hypothetical protein
MRNSKGQLLYHLSDTLTSENECTSSDKYRIIIVTYCLIEVMEANKMAWHVSSILSVWCCILIGFINTVACRYQFG